MNITDAEGSYLAAKSEVQEWQEQFMAQWFEPQIALMELMLYQRLDPETRNNLRQMAPEGMKKFEAKIAKITGG